MVNAGWASAFGAVKGIDSMEAPWCNVLYSIKLWGYHHSFFLFNLLQQVFCEGCDSEPSRIESSGHEIDRVFIYIHHFSVAAAGDLGHHVDCIFLIASYCMLHPELNSFGI